MDFMPNDGAILKSIKRVDNYYEIVAQQRTDEKEMVYIDVNCVCPVLAEMAQKSEDGCTTVDETIYLDIPDCFEYEGPARNKGWSRCAYIDENPDA